MVSKEFNHSWMTQSQIQIALLSNDCQLTCLFATIYKQNIIKQTLSRRKSKRRDLNTNIWKLLSLTMLKILGRNRKGKNY